MALGSGAVSVLPITARDIGSADSANYYVATTPTMGTGIISGTPLTLVETTPSFIVFNGGLLNVYLLYLRLLVTVASTGNVTTTNFSHSIDQGNRYGVATLGTQLTINNTNIMSNTRSSVQATWGPIVTAGVKTANARILQNDWFRVALIPIVGDIYEFQYGAPSGIGIGSSPATVAHFIKTCPAVVLQPQSSYILNVWATTTFTTGITCEVSMGFIEK